MSHDERGSAARQSELLQVSVSGGPCQAAEQLTAEICADHSQVEAADHTTTMLGDEQIAAAILLPKHGLPRLPRRLGAVVNDVQGWQQRDAIARLMEAELPIDLLTVEEEGFVQFADCVER